MIGYIDVTSDTNEAWSLRPPCAHHQVEKEDTHEAQNENHR